MSGLAERIQQLRDLWRHRSGAQWVLLAVGVASVWALVALMAAWFGGRLSTTGVVLVGVVGSVAVVLGESILGHVTVAAVIVWWFLVAGQCAWWQPVVAGALLWSWHWCSAVSSAAPSHAPFGPGLLASAGRHGLIVAAAGALLAGLVWLAGATPSSVVPRGWWWLAVLVVVVAAASWWWAGARDRPDTSAPHHPASPGSSS